MAEKAQTRVQEAVDKLVDELDKSTLRRLQGQMHQCSYKCCENMDATIQQVHRCIEDCTKPISKAQSYVQEEMNNFQNRLQRCVMNCQDGIRDKVTSNTTEAQVSAFRGEFEDCVVKCADDHVALLPAMFKRMKAMLESEKH